MAGALNRGIHKDCPFDKEDIMAFYDMLYQVNAGNRCANPAPTLWAAGSQMYEQIRSEREMEEYPMDELERLRKENEELKNKLKKYE